MELQEGQTRKNIVGAGVVFISPESDILPCGYSLIELWSNNVTEYNAIIIGLQIAKEMGDKALGNLW